MLRRLCALTGQLWVNFAELACVALATSLPLLPASSLPISKREGRLSPFSNIPVLLKGSLPLHSFFLGTANSQDQKHDPVKLCPGIFPKLCAPVIQPNPLRGNCGIPGPPERIGRNLSPSPLTACSEPPGSSEHFSLTSGRQEDLLYLLAFLFKKKHFMV